MHGPAAAGSSDCAQALVEVMLGATPQLNFLQCSVTRRWIISGWRPAPTTRRCAPRSLTQRDKYEQMVRQPVEIFQRDRIDGLAAAPAPRTSRSARRVTVRAKCSAAAQGGGRPATRTGWSGCQPAPIELVDLALQAIDLGPSATRSLPSSAAPRPKTPGTDRRRDRTDRFGPRQAPHRCRARPRAAARSRPRRWPRRPCRRPRPANRPCRTRLPSPSEVWPVSPPRV